MRRAPRLLPRLIPSLLARDIAETIAFYTAIGFQVTGYYPSAEHPEWVELSRDGVTLRFYTAPPPGTPVTPVCSGTFYFFPEDVEALAEAWRGVVEFAWGPEVMDYGVYEFGIQDPNGYYLAFAGPAQEAA